MSDGFIFPDENEYRTKILDFINYTPLHTEVNIKTFDGKPYATIDEVH